MSASDPKRTSAVLLLCIALLSSDDVVRCSARAATPMRRRNFIAGLASAVADDGDRDVMAGADAALGPPSYFSILIMRVVVAPQSSQV
jgi:hypothetical protein